MANYCDNHCLYYEDNKCNHPTFPRNKTFLKVDGKKCGGFKGTPGINDRETYKKKMKEEKKMKENKIKEEQLERSLQLLEEEGIEIREGYENFFKLNRLQQFYVFETVVRKRKKKDVMQDIYEIEKREIPKNGLYPRIRIWNNNPNIIKATKEMINVVADKTKIELELIVEDMVEKVKVAIAEVDTETSLPEDIIKMTKDLVDIRSKLKDQASNINVGSITFTFGDGSTLADIFKEDNLETIVIDADYDER